MRILVLVVALGTSAFALDVHPDYRFSYGQCWTWGSGNFSTVRPYLRMTEGWDGNASNYPIDWRVLVGCQYKSDADPMPQKPGEFIVKGSQWCPCRTVIPKVCSGGVNDMKKCHVAMDCPGGMCVPGTTSATSCPLGYIWVNADYNGGGYSFPSGCIWDPWEYGAPMATTTTTTLP